MHACMRVSRPPCCWGSLIALCSGNDSAAGSGAGSAACWASGEGAVSSNVSVTSTQLESAACGCSSFGAELLLVSTLLLPPLLLAPMVQPRRTRAEGRRCMATRAHAPGRLGAMGTDLSSSMAEE